MRFVVPTALLAELQQYRAEQRARRRARREEGQRTQGSLVETVKQLFDGKSAEAAADDYVRGMDSLQDEVEREHDAYLLDPGMGPMAYLTADGRVLLDHRSFDGDSMSEANEDQAIATIVVGARKTGIAALLDLAPAMPADAASCTRCAGTRWDPQLSPTVCMLCRGRGWQRA